MEENPNRAEAERLLGIAEKLLQSPDLNGSRDFAILAQETEPLLDGSDQILAVCDVLLAAEKRINNHHDWYSILQLDRRSDDHESIKKQYRRLALLLHPDKNKFPHADHAFKLVADAWAVLSDPPKKSLYDNELSLFSKIDLSNAGKLPVRRTQQKPVSKNQQQQQRGGGGGVSGSGESGYEDQRLRLSSFWTVCPYCYLLYEYPRVYENCCLRCQSCRRAFHAVLIPSLPPMVPGKEAYYCCWGCFPLGFAIGDGGGGKGMPAAVSGFPNWMPPVFSSGRQQEGGKNSSAGAGAGAGAGVERRDRVVDVSDGNGREVMVTARKRGRPRKNPVQV